MSADAITYSTLHQQTNSSAFSEHDLTPVGTDEDEYARWQATLAPGTTTEGYDDYTDDFQDAGLIPDNNGNRYGL